MYRHHRSHLENREDFVAARARFERGADVPASAVRIEVRAGGIERNADQFDELPRQDLVSPRIGRHLQARFGPGRIPFEELADRRIPWTCLVRRTGGSRLLAAGHFGTSKMRTAPNAARFRANRTRDRAPSFIPRPLALVAPCSRPSGESPHRSLRWLSCHPSPTRGTLPGRPRGWAADQDCAASPQRCRTRRRSS